MKPGEKASPPADEPPVVRRPGSVESRLGTLVRDRYRLDRLVGRGGSGATFAAHDVQLMRDVAVKLLMARDGDVDVMRFMQEARIASSLRHPHIVEVFDVGIDEQGFPFLVMELLTGQTLQHAIRERKSLPAEEAFARLLPIMGAVAVAHDRGVLHRDLKPDNIFLSRDLSGRIVPKLLDFGVAKMFEGATLTRSGAVVGTPAYMSPEQALDEQLSHASDVWALGVVWFVTLSGQLPFRGDGLTGVLLKIVNEPAPLLSSVAPELPRTLAASVDRALRRDKGARYGSVREFARTLLGEAHAAGIAVPKDPEPVGLPDVGRWLREFETSLRTAETRKVSAVLPSEAVPRDLVPTGATPPVLLLERNRRGFEERRRKAWKLVGLAAAIALLVAGLWMLTGTSVSETTTSKALESHEPAAREPRPPPAAPPAATNAVTASPATGAASKPTGTGSEPAPSQAPARAANTGAPSANDEAKRSRAAQHNRRTNAKAKPRTADDDGLELQDAWK